MCIATLVYPLHHVALPCRDVDRSQWSVLLGERNLLVEAAHARISARRYAISTDGGLMRGNNIPVYGGSTVCFGRCVTICGDKFCVTVCGRVGFVVSPLESTYCSGPGMGIAE